MPPVLEGTEHEAAEEDLLDDGCTDDHYEEQQDDAEAVGLVDQLAGRLGDVKVVGEQQDGDVQQRHQDRLGTYSDCQARQDVAPLEREAQVGGPGDAVPAGKPARNAQQAGPERHLEQGHERQWQVGL